MMLSYCHVFFLPLILIHFNDRYSCWNIVVCIYTNKLRIGKGVSNPKCWLFSKSSDKINKIIIFYFPLYSPSSVQINQSFSECELCDTFINNGLWIWIKTILTPHFSSMKRCCDVLLLPQTAGGVAEHDRGVQLEFVLIVKVSAAPARVRDDHSVGHAA